MSSLDWSLIKKTPAPNIIIIAGPTASGKTKTSLEIATEIGGEIINADSMQLYKDLPILSALPTMEERSIDPYHFSKISNHKETRGRGLGRIEIREYRRHPDVDDVGACFSGMVSHHLYGILEAHEQFSVAMWLEEVSKLLSAVLERGKTPLIVGGTGLYINALLHGLYTLPLISPENRQKARNDWEKLGVEKFHSMLAHHDPASAAILHPNDKQRLIRSWEIFLETGKSIQTFRSQSSLSPIANFNVLKFLLFPDKEELKKRADLRFDKMIEMGAVEEVRNLLDRGVPLSAPIFRTLGARDLALYLLGEQTLEQACEKAKIATHQYIKRQRTWFRHQYSACQTIIDYPL